MKYINHILTEEDIENNPELTDAGLGVGDEIQYTEQPNIEKMSLETPDGDIEIPQSFTIKIDGNQYVLTHAEIVWAVQNVYGEDEVDL